MVEEQEPNLQPGPDRPAASRRRARLGVLIARVERRLEQWQARDQLLLRVRLAIVLIILAGLGLALGFGTWPFWIVPALFLLVLFPVAMLHQRVRRRRDRWLHNLELQRQHLARIELDWESIPQFDSQAQTASPEERDLDLVGSESLSRLLDASLTDGGSAQLTGWLRAGREPGELAEQQAVVRELAPLQLFRNRLSRKGAAAARGRIQVSPILTWAQSEDRSRLLLGALRISALLIALAGSLAAIHLAWGGPALWLFPLAGNLLFVVYRQQQIDSVFQLGLALELEFFRLRRLLEPVETFEFRGRPQLRRLTRALQARDQRPSGFFRRVARWVALLSVRAYPLFWLPLNLVFPWDFLCGWRLEGLRVRSKHQVLHWLEALHRLDAACSLALFAHLHPNYAFPEFVPLEKPPHFQAHHMGHPLIPVQRRVCNDFRLVEPGSIALVTGSNMAGKSTFLRTVGINLRLAYAGAPVCASALHTSCFRVFTCIRISDSVTDGYSYFYAEVKRLRELLDQLDREGAPMLFLIDEIFKGTNNRERLIGSRSFIRRLAQSSALGLISTHDLELTRLSEELPRLSNLHFREAVRQGKMSFDYQLHPGPCPTTNALKIMRLAGLPVEG